MELMAAYTGFLPTKETLGCAPARNPPVLPIWVYPQAFGSGGLAIDFLKKGNELYFRQKIKKKKESKIAFLTQFRWTVQWENMLYEEKNRKTLVVVEWALGG